MPPIPALFWSSAGWIHLCRGLLLPPSFTYFPAFSALPTHGYLYPVHSPAPQILLSSLLLSSRLFLFSCWHCVFYFPLSFQWEVLDGVGIKVCVHLIMETRKFLLFFFGKNNIKLFLLKKSVYSFRIFEQTTISLVPLASKRLLGVSQVFQSLLTFSVLEEEWVISHHFSSLQEEEVLLWSLSGILRNTVAFISSPFALQPSTKVSV